LWVVPTTQIYRQTLKSLQDRDHPYRQHLDIASGGRTTILEKTATFSPIDVMENLVVMLLMLPSASRKVKDVLRIFKDSGNFQEFFPAEDDIEGGRDLLKRVGNLDTFEAQHGFWGRQIKTSLGNTLRIMNPVLILDEGHKAYSETAQDTIRGFNPSIIVELSATPVAGSNVLVDIKGIELDREEMIKFDLHVINKASLDWKDTLLSAHNHVQTLQDKARDYEGNSGNYIRPICLIQAERTGRDQRDGRFIHSEDVREHLIQKLGIAAEEVAVKTSEKDELKEVDDVGGLMSRNCRIRYIITKQALQEGWDCAFAYVLCVLTNPSSVTGMTQLVGRILRQPYAKKTRIKELDESYVFCYQRRGAVLLEDIRSGFRDEGLGDLTGRIGMDEGGEDRGTQTERTCDIREQFRAAAERAILPVFAIRQNGGWRPVNYAMDIIGRIPWNEINLETIFEVSLSQIEEKDIEQVAGISTDPHEVIHQKDAVRLKHGSLKLDPVFMARQLLELTPNPWVAYDLSKTILSRFVQQYDTERVTNNFVFLIEEARKLLAVEIDRLSKKVFQEMIVKGLMRFLVIARELGGYSLPTKENRSIQSYFDKTGWATTGAIVV
jgi:type III restriction enzyme